jgi:hypothetical protein
LDTADAAQSLFVQHLPLPRQTPPHVVKPGWHEVATQLPAVQAPVPKVTAQSASVQH